MKLVKKILLLVISSLPLPLAISYAAEYSENIEMPVVSFIDITAEFIRQYERNLLSPKYIEYLEENDIFSVDDLNLPINEDIKDIVINRFLLEYRDTQLKTNAVVSII